MADIAFLLLIFFLVTTTILEDQGIAVRLPVWTENIIASPLADRNVLLVKVNADNQLMVEGEVTTLDQLRTQTKEFIINPKAREDLAEKPTKAVVSLQNDRGTNYEAYISVYNELKAAYNELWSDLSRRKFGIPYSEDMPTAMKKAVRSEIPFVLSEAEPTDFKE